MRLQAIMLLIAVSTLCVQGQTARATLTGEVTDASGAVLANVQVKALHVDTGTEVTGTTSQTGNYTIPQLPVGRYVVTVEASGFKQYRREGLTLSSTQIQRLDIGMEVGATTEAITVTAESTMLKTDSGTLVHNITPQEIQNLPLLNVGVGTLFIRDPFQLSLTMPGVVSGGVGFSPRVNGLPSGTNQYRLDGEILGQLGSRPSPLARSPARTRSKRLPCRPATSPRSSDRPRALCLTSPSSRGPTSITAPCTTTWSTKR